MTVTYLSITPHDPIIARDGRPFGNGQRMKSLDWPYPSVVAGSLRTMLGKMIKGDNFSKETISALKQIKVSGPLPLHNGRIYFPAPKDLLINELSDDRRDAYPIRPMKMNEDEGCNLPYKTLWPAMLPETVKEDFKPSAITPFWSFEKMTYWLADANGNSFESTPAPDKIFDTRDYLNLPEKDVRTHVKIEEKSGSAKESMLFQTTGLDFRLRNKSQGIQMTVKVESENEFGIFASNLDSYHPLGGERRLALWKADNKQSGWACPEKIKKILNGTERIRMILATPGIFSHGWLPGWLKDKGDVIEGSPPSAPDITLRLVSACVDRWKPLSGWSMETKGPKPVRRIVPEGSVYFFERVNNGDTSDIGNKLWLKSVCDNKQDRQDGFGLALWGIWNA